ncbi:flagellar assembly protein FlaJ [Nitrosopumilus sp. b1]|uniref:flagellar assembly protein FlaJ n=1 Tax=Nitrosopumilus sp. b1 TaxID=2109907 RepID=UPI002107224F|nr:flagellar assembly protein FlaJ [Nitrosopumilus sp. b1]
MELAKFPLINKLATGGGAEAIDEKFVYFMAFLYSISTGEVESVDMIKTASKSGYGKFSQAFMDTFRLGVGWSYGLSKSLEMIANKVAQNNEIQLKQILVKLAQVVRLGDDLKTFFHAEVKSAIMNFEIIYERKLETQKLFLEMFYTLMSTAAFMVSANSIMTMLMGSNDAEDILLSSLIGVSISMTVFVFLMYMMFPRDKLAYATADDDLKFRLRVYMMAGVGAGIGIVLFMIPDFPNTLAVGAAVAPLIIPGLKAKKMESQIKELNQAYPEFIRHFGEIYATVGSMGQALDAVLRSDFGPLQKHVIGFKNRIKNRIDQKLGFELLSRDAGSEIIANGNQVISTAMDKGGDMNETGNVVADITLKMNELRAKRSQTAKTFETVVVVLHILTLAVFGLMNKLTEIFFELINTVDVSNSTFQLTPIDPEFMAAMMPVMIIMTSVLSAVAIKVAQGGLYKTVFYNIAILAVLGAIVSFVMNFMLADFLETHILDFVDETVP